MATSSIIALDVGEKRIGVARAYEDLGFASPLVTIDHNENVWQTLQNLITEQDAQIIVVGLPRNLRGDETSQTLYCKNFAAEVHERFGLPVKLQDEALTSEKAEAELRTKKKDYKKSDIDALAATYILEDYLQSAEAKS